MTSGGHNRIYGRLDPEIIEIALPESLFMNHVERNPSTSPFGLCDEVRLRSSNASALLRSLETNGGHYDIGTME